MVLSAFIANVTNSCTLEMALAATTANSALEPVAAEGATAMRMDIEATLAQFQVLLEPCKRSEAQRATQIRKQLKKFTWQVACRGGPIIIPREAPEALRQDGALFG